MPMNFPDAPTNGMTYTSGNSVWTWSSATQTWNPQQTSGSGGGASITISDTAPVGSPNGALWWNSSPGDGQLYINFNDGSSTQWVIGNSATSGTSNLYLPLSGGTVTGAVTINLNTVTPPALGGGFTQNLWIVGSDAAHAGLNLDAFGVGASAVTLHRKSLGTAAAPTAIQSGNYISATYYSGCYAASTYYIGASLAVSANENWTGSARGSAMTFGTTPNGTTAVVPSLTLNGNTATFSGSVYAAVNMTVSGQAWPGYIADKPASGSGAALLGRTAGKNRWILYVGDSVAEGGSNAGSNFHLERYDDNGNWIDNPFQINRNNAAAQFSSTVSALYAFTCSAPTGNPAFQTSTSNRTWAWGHNQGDSAYFVYDATAGVNRIAINTSGACSASSSWSIISDAAAKTDIIDHPRGLTDILKLQPRQFRYSGEYGLEGIGTGLIAQELEKVMPELVRDMPVDHEGATAKTIVETGIIWPLINAVKELAARVAELESR